MSFTRPYCFTFQHVHHDVWEALAVSVMPFKSDHSYLNQTHKLCQRARGGQLDDDLVEIITSSTLENAKAALRECVTGITRATYTCVSECV